jgi:hypothetical protein
VTDPRITRQAVLEFLSLSHTIRATAEKQRQNVTFEVKEVRELDVDAKTGKFRLVLRAAV